MQEHKTYNTKQKEALINFFKQNPEMCFSPADIINNPNLKMGSATVYRLLTKLKNEGIIKSFLLGEKKFVAYQYNSCGCEHFHLKCLKCGELIHSECDVIKSMQAHISSEHGFIIDSSKTVLYGICKECTHFLAKESNIK